MLIDGEHAPNDPHSTLGALQAIAPHRSESVVRVLTGEIARIKQLLNIGVQNLLATMLDTAEQARGLVIATRDPALGVRAWAAVGRASRFSLRTA